MSLLDDLDKMFREIRGKRCPDCDGLHLKEYSGQYVCLDCGRWVKSLEDCLSHDDRELMKLPFPMKFNRAAFEQHLREVRENLLKKIEKKERRKK